VDEGEGVDRITTNFRVIFLKTNGLRYYRVVKVYTPLKSEKRGKKVKKIIYLQYSIDY